MSAYTEDVLAIYCSTCEAPAGERCRIYSELLGRVRELREPHPARVKFATHRARRGKKGR